MKIIEELDPIVIDAFEDLYNQLEKSKILKNQKIEDADNIRIKGKYLKQMQGVFKKHFRTIYLDGQGMAKAEVKRSNNAVENNNIAADEFLDFLNRETFQYLGDYEYQINKKTRTLLTNAIKDGDTISSVVGILDDEGKKLSDVSLERYSRTKTTEVFNRGRKEYFDSTGVVSAYQFSAILDDVTSEICGNLNGLTFPAGTAPIPPLHFNCRSVLIPITKYEDYQIDQVTNTGVDLDKFLEENVTDKGFAVYSSIANSELVDKPETPDITDPRVSFKTSYNGNLEVIEYSFEGKHFQTTTIVYEDNKRQKIISTEHKKI
jgi:SPP1 gp7 family putative phage head morphogenesis protein